MSTSTEACRNCDARYAEWQAWIRSLFDRAVHLAHTDAVYWQVRAVAQESEAWTQHGETLSDWMAYTWATTSLTVLRTLLGERTDEISLVGLLIAMKNDAHVLTFERYQALRATAGSGVSALPEPLRAAEKRRARARVRSDFDRFAGVARASDIPSETIRLDLVELKRQVGAIKKYTNTYVTHVAKKPKATLEPLTEADVRRAIVSCFRLVGKYYALLRGGAICNFVPVDQTNWLAVLREPWLRANQAVPGYQTLDDLLNATNSGL